jgi:hypothetical protein
VAATHLGFLRSARELRDGIFIPKYYDPTVDARLRGLAETRRLVKLGDLVDSGAITVHYGHDIGKHHYGLGDIPYVRTSDLASWEIVSAPKQTVSEETYEHFQAKQDVRAGDVLFVRDGLYLIGTAALVTDFDLPLIHQSHLIRFRVSHDAGFSPAALIAALATPVVRQQVRAKQFTAGIIDKIEDRYRELVLPFPLSPEEATRLTKRTTKLVERRVELREVLRSIPLWITGENVDPRERTVRVRPEPLSESILGFTRRARTIQEIFIPKYYDPSVETELEALADGFDLQTIDDLETRELIEVTTGIEVGKLAYGQGDVPFVRTSDLADWELAGVPKHRISATLYERLRTRADVQAGDIFVVRDGTYLVGTSAIVTEADARALFAGGLYKIRSVATDELDPYLLLALLNLRIVKKQIRAKRFTRDIIDTLGRRLFEIILPVPRDQGRRHEIAELTRQVVEERVALRDEAREISFRLGGVLATEDDELTVDALSVSDPGVSEFHE